MRFKIQVGMFAAIQKSHVYVSPEWAESLTEMGKGKHFIGDFLPPEELEKFMETFKALKVSVFYFQHML